MSESQHVGPIIFGHPVARRQLVEEGEVVTFRVNDRTTGETWWRESRTGPKRGDVTVEFIGEVLTPFDLAEHVDKSGFASIDDWQDAIKEVHGEDARAGGLLYRATSRKEDLGESHE